MHIKYDNSTAIYNSLKPYTLAGFEPGIFCSVGGRDDHYTTAPGLSVHILCINFGKNNLLGYVLGDFFTKSSGHPDRKSRHARASAAT
jgi:hypothetical protein